MDQVDTLHVGRYWSEFLANLSQRPIRLAYRMAMLRHPS